MKLELPILQNWSCHSCGGCCKQHLIEVTDAERQRILEQNWTAKDEIHQPALEWHSGPPWRKNFRLAHKKDGGCVFLDEKGLCRIHAKFGEAAKPLACRIYPYAFHPAGKSFAVSLRFSCPSVVSNLGTPVCQQNSEIRRLAEAAIPANAEKCLPPHLTARDRLDWPDTLAFVEALDQTMSDTSVPIVLRIVRAVTWTSLVGQSSFEKLRGPRVRELISLLVEAAKVEFPAVPQNQSAPTSTGLLYFRTLVAQYARKDTVADLSKGWWTRWNLFRAILKFTRGKGDAPSLQPAFRSVPFSSMETQFGDLTPEVDTVLTRYFRVKIQGLHFCGLGYYGVPFVEGFHSLALMLPVILWLARWLAVSDGRTHLLNEDITRALAIADHNHGYSPQLGQHAARHRVRALAANSDLSRLCFYYAR